MSFDRRLIPVVESIVRRAAVKKTFLRDLRKPPLADSIRVLEDIDRLLSGTLPAGQAKRLAGYRQEYGQLACGEYRAIFKRNPWEFLFIFHKNEQKRRLKHL